MNNQEVGRFIRQLRTSKNMTQKELAEKLFITDKAISKWERGLGCPDVSVLPLLADTLGVQIEDILNGSQVSLQDANETVNNEPIQETKSIKAFLKKRHVRIILLISLTISCIFAVVAIISVVAIMPDGLSEVISALYSLLIAWLTIISIFCFLPIASSYAWYRLSSNI